MSCWTLNIKTVSEANCSEHWTRSSKRHRTQKDFIRLWGRQNNISPSLLPCVIKLTRLAPGKLDAHDNLRISLKWIVDAICDSLIPGLKPGQSDSSPRISIEYDQSYSPIYAIKIEIRSGEELD